MNPTLRGLKGATLAAGAFAITFLPGRLSDRPRPRGPSKPPLAAALESSPERTLWIQRVEKQLKARIERIPAADCSRLAEAIVDEAKAAKLDPALILAIIQVESGYDLDALSHKGASGLMQLIPSTFHGEATRSRFQADDLNDPVLNVRAGVRYYRRLLGSFRSPEYALMAYNAGPQRISGYLKAGGVPDRFREYPRRVFSEMRRVRRVFALESETLVAENLPRRARQVAE